jgi:hypothetical protein
MRVMETGIALPRADCAARGGAGGFGQGVRACAPAQAGVQNLAVPSWTPAFAGAHIRSGLRPSPGHASGMDPGFRWGAHKIMFKS